MRKRALAVLAVCLLLFAALPAARAHAVAVLLTFLADR